MKIRRVIKLLEKNGWYLDRIKGDHRQFKHNGKKGAVTISGHENDEISKGTFNSVLKQAGLKKRRDDGEVRDLLFVHTLGLPNWHWFAEAIPLR